MYFDQKEMRSVGITIVLSFTHTFTIHIGYYQTISSDKILATLRRSINSLICKITNSILFIQLNRYI